MGGSVLLVVLDALMNQSKRCYFPPYSINLSPILWPGLIFAMRTSSQWVAPQYQSTALFCVLLL